MAGIEISTEEESGRGWTYHVRIAREHGKSSEHTVHLSWADHEHWSGGRCAPSRVVESLLRYLVEREEDRPIPAKFDAATARRWWPGIDGELVV